MKKTRQALKDRFRTGMYPTESDFGDVYDSYVHQDDTIDTNKVQQTGLDGVTVSLPEVLGQKAEQTQVTNIDERLTGLEERTGDIDDLRALQSSMDSLSERMDTLETVATSTFNFRGSVTVEQLATIPTDQLAAGDVYNITDSGTIGDISVNDGDCLAWNGTAWNVLSYTDYTQIYAQIAQKLDLQQLGYPTFSVTATYSAGQIVINEGYLVRFTADHTPGPWTAEDSEDVTIAELLAELSPAALFNIVEQLERDNVTQAAQIAETSNKVSALMSSSTTLENRIQELEEHQGEVDLSAVYARIGQVDDKTDTAIGDATDALAAATSAKTTAEAISQKATNALAAATTAETNAAAASTLANSVSAQVDTITEQMSTLEVSLDQKVTNGGGCGSMRTMSLAAYDELSVIDDTAVYLLTAN